MAKLFYSSRSQRLIAFSRIKNLPISSSLRKKVRKEYLSNFFRKRIVKQPGQMSFLGQKLFYPNFRHLAHIFSEVYLGNVYFFEAPNEEPFIFDLGANIGMTSIYFKMLYPNSKIVAIEANQKTFNILNKNLKPYTDITIYNNAATNELGTISFYSEANRIGSGQNSTIPNKHLLAEKTEVEAILLSSLITQQVDLLKIDIEGGELAVFKDLKAHQSLKYVDKVIMEFHYKQCGLAGLDFILETLEEAGFTFSFGDCPVAPAWEGGLDTMMIYAWKSHED